MARRVTRSSLLVEIVLVILGMALILGIVSLFGGDVEKDSTEYSKNSQHNDLVYADITSITPTSTTSKLGKKDYEGFFCTCETVDGKSIDVYVSSFKFGKYIKKKSQYSWDNWNRVVPDTVEFDTPLRIFGRLEKVKNIVSISKDESLVINISKSDRPTED